MFRGGSSFHIGNPQLLVLPQIWFKRSETIHWEICKNKRLLKRIFTWSTLEDKKLSRQYWYPARVFSFMTVLHAYTGGEKQSFH